MESSGKKRLLFEKSGDLPGTTPPAYTTIQTFYG